MKKELIVRIFAQGAAAASVIALLAGGASAQVILSDNFNAENGGNASLNYTGFAQWTVTKGTVDVFNFGYAGEGALSVDLNGSTNQGGTIQTKNALSLTAGTYDLAFDLGKNGNSFEDMTVSLGSVYSERFTDSLSYPQYVHIDRTITVNSDTTGKLQFASFVDSNSGYVLDNIALTRTNVAAPEASPAALLALGLPLIGLVGMVRRRDLRSTRS